MSNKEFRPTIDGALFLCEGRRVKVVEASIGMSADFGRILVQFKDDDSFLTTSYSSLYREYTPDCSYIVDFETCSERALRQEIQIETQIVLISKIPCKETWHGAEFGKVILSQAGNNALDEVKQRITLAENSARKSRAYKNSEIERLKFKLKNGESVRLYEVM